MAKSVNIRACKILLYILTQSLVLNKIVLCVQ